MMLSNTKYVNESFHRELKLLKSKLDTAVNDSEFESVKVFHEAFEGLVNCPAAEEFSSLYGNFKKSILDLTFQMENKLVDDDFRSPYSAKKISGIIGLLRDMESLDQYVDESSNNEEMHKCVLWRQGALLYMYCATLFSNKEQRQNELKNPHIPHFLADGINYLKAMLSVYKPVDTESSGSLVLLNKGIRDSTDVLALMYAGEMCYFDYVLNVESGNSGPSSECPHRELGIQFLKKYVEVVEGDLCNQFWSCDRAKDLLKILTVNTTSSS